VDFADPIFNLIINRVKVRYQFLDFLILYYRNLDKLVPSLQNSFSDQNLDLLSTITKIHLLHVSTMVNGYYFNYSFLKSQKN